MTLRTGLTQQDNERRPLEFTPAVIARNAALVALALSAAAQVSVPLGGVAAPFTLQSLAVILAGPIAGARAGTLGILVYLFLGAIGLPVFANGASGWDVLTGPTAGFLWVFLLIPTPLAHLARRVDGSWSGIWFGAFLAVHMALLLLGFLWIALPSGDFGALASWGAYLPGAVLKSMLGVFVLRFMPTHVTRSASRRRPRIGPDA